MTAGSRFDALVSGLDYPMYIVTAAAGDRRAGCLVGFGSQCGIDPPRFMVWLSKKNETYEVACSARTLAVHVPRARDHALAELFGGVTGRERDKFAQVEWRPGPEGVPLLADCDQWFVGTVLSRHDTGDHEGFLLAPAAAGEAHGAPQLPFQQIRNLPPGNAP
ncbi:flavin reductase family protein [Actinophytocola glycyrrhizae]|uniref:Flavin reductase family protein n=1 Tax=Actinophytocola glycyrrhizae TaxID=2044873 RepID=A0ABV9S4X8_9PSEU